MMEDQKIMVKKSYDPVEDSLYIRSVEDYNYRESVELGMNMILDFDENKTPVALEILDASKVLNVTPFALQHLKKCNIRILINKRSIILSAKFTVPIHNKGQEKPLNVETTNDLNIPQIEANLAST